MFSALPVKPFWREMHAGKSASALLVLQEKRNGTLCGPSVQFTVSRDLSGFA